MSKYSKKEQKKAFRGMEEFNSGIHHSAPVKGTKVKAGKRPITNSLNDSWEDEIIFPDKVSRRNHDAKQQALK